MACFQGHILLWKENRPDDFGHRGEVELLYDLIVFGMDTNPEP